MENKIITKTISGLLLCSMVGYTLPVFAYEKDETVYSKLDSIGNNYKTIVSTHIKNTENEELIKDMSDLLNIKNTNGDETFTQEGNTFIWNANKNDIYYQGDSEKELPIECKVTYELDGKEVSAKDIAGKSGNVKIKLEYINKEVRTIDINGKKVKMYVPFVVVAGTIIKNDNNKNINITNGKVVDDGTKTTILGMAMPGLQESLGLSKNEVEIPESIEISMDATDFETDSIISYVTPKVFEKEDLKIFDKLDDVYNKVNTLKDSSAKLADGTKELSEGIRTATNGVSTMKKEVKTSVNKLTSDNSSALTNEQLTQIGTAAKAQAEAGIDAQKTQISEQMMTSSKQIAEETAYNTALQIAAQTAASTVENTLMQVYVQNYLETNGIANPTQEQLNAIRTNIATAKANEIATAKANAASNAQAGIQAQCNTIKANAANGIEAKRGTISTQAVASAKQIAGTTAEATATSVATNVSEAVKKGALEKVAQKMSALTNGLDKLENGMTKLNEGSLALSEGMSTFDKEGIEKINNAINGNVKDLTERIEKLTELAKDYNNFTLLSDGNEAEVKFIMIIDAIKKQEDSEQDKEEAILNTESLRIEEEK